MTCKVCKDVGWVCENHPERPWEGPEACKCDGAGAPCPACNIPSNGEAPRLPALFRIEFDKDGWRH